MPTIFIDENHRPAPADLFKPCYFRNNKGQSQGGKVGQGKFLCDKCLNPSCMTEKYEVLPWLLEWSACHWLLRPKHQGPLLFSVSAHYKSAASRPVRQRHRGLIVRTLPTCPNVRSESCFITATRSAYQWGASLAWRLCCQRLVWMVRAIARTMVRGHGGT